jgi:hypothetical protein
LVIEFREYTKVYILAYKINVISVEQEDVSLYSTPFWYML